ncbi:MAG: Zn-ribbon domain-containing OB-fold protein [Acidimicrobiales bacterium]
MSESDRLPVDPTAGHVLGRPERRMLPEPTWESRAFWTGGERNELLIHRCRDCGRFFHPPAPACFRCRSTNVAPEPVSGHATVAAYSVNVHQWLPGFPPPYVVAIVELDEEPDTRLTTNIVACDPADVAIGMPVRVEFESWDDVWIPLFRPVTA